MCEHLEERVSERLQGTLNQPQQRGYLPGCHQRGTQGVGKNGYSVRTLMGNWNEEQADLTFSTRRPLLLSDEERKLNEQRTSITAKPNSYVRIDHTFAADQRAMVDVVDKRHTIFPGHQPLKDPHLVNKTFDQWGSETKASFSNPAAKDARRPSRGHGKALSPQDKEAVLINKVRALILSRGGGEGFRGIRRSLTVLDQNGNGQLSKEEIMEGMALYGLRLVGEEADIVFGYFDRDRSGQVSITEFVAGVRGGMNDRRLKLVRQAYKCLDKNFDGRVTFEDIQMAYDASKHPQVLSGTLTEDDVLKEFISSWDQDGSTEVTLDEFVSYYNDISAGIDNEQFFELMIRNAWHLSGGQGAAQNTSCRRVLVTHHNGQQTVEEVKNDLGIGPDDIEKMTANLQAQGVSDIARIDLNF